MQYLFIFLVVFVLSLSITFLIRKFSKILGLVDNMSYFIGDDNKKYNIFASYAGKKSILLINKKVKQSKNIKSLVQSNLHWMIVI